MLGRDSNRDPDRYQANSIHYSNNNNSYNNVDGFNNLGDGSLSHIFRCGSKRCQFQNRFVSVNDILSTTTNRLYKRIVPAGSTYINDHSANVVYLITCNICKLQYVGETSQNINKISNWHNSCFRNPTAYSFCKILNAHFSKDYCKDSSYTVNIIKKLEGTGRTEKNTKDFAAKPLRKARGTYWMHELRTIFSYGLNGRIGDEFKTDNKHINVADKFSSFPRKYSRANRGKSHKGVPRLLPQQFVKDLNHILNTSIKDAPNFIRISISSMKKSYLKITHQLLSRKVCDSPSDFIFSIYYHQAIDLIKSKLYKPLIPKSKKKPSKNV